MKNDVLILGGTGRFGRQAAEAFWNAGWRVRLFDRHAGDLMKAARGADVIVNAWNPAYPDWAAQVPGLTRSVIAAARSSGARVILPGNVYVFGPDCPAPWGADSPHRATNPLGRVRIEMEQAYHDAGVPTLILRAGDFLDTEASGNWFDRMMAPSLKRGVLTYPGRTDIPHAWAWLPDMARAAELLARRDDLPVFADVPFPGYSLSGEQMAALAAKVLGREVGTRRMSWLPLRLARPAWPMAKSLLEMRYLWETPHWLDDRAFRALLPDFAVTDPEEAMQRAIAPVLAPTPQQDRPRPARAAPPSERHP